MLKRSLKEQVVHLFHAFVRLVPVLKDKKVEILKAVSVEGLEQGVQYFEHGEGLSVWT